MVSISSHRSDERWSRWRSP